jgi:hypothetical protein
MDRGVENGPPWLWRICAAVLVYPISVLAAVNGSLLLVSVVCFRLDSWSAEGAMGNLSLGLPLVLGVTALWVSILYPYGRLVRERHRFVLVATGLLAALGVDGMFLIARLRIDPASVLSLPFSQLWMIVGPLVAGSVNLGYLVSARQHIFDALEPEPGRVIPRNHLTPQSELRPVVLKRYRPPISNR